MRGRPPGGYAFPAAAAKDHDLGLQTAEFIPTLEARVECGRVHHPGRGPAGGSFLCLPQVQCLSSGDTVYVGPQMVVAPRVGSPAPCAKPVAGSTRMATPGRLPSWGCRPCPDPQGPHPQLPRRGGPASPPSVAFTRRVRGHQFGCLGFVAVTAVGRVLAGRVLCSPRGAPHPGPGDRPSQSREGPSGGGPHAAGGPVAGACSRGGCAGPRPPAPSAPPGPAAELSEPSAGATRGSVAMGTEAGRRARGSAHGGSEAGRQLRGWAGPGSPAAALWPCGRPLSLCPRVAVPLCPCPDLVLGGRQPCWVGARP